MNKSEKRAAHGDPRQVELPFGHPESEMVLFEEVQLSRDSKIYLSENADEMEIATAIDQACQRSAAIGEVSIVVPDAVLQAPTEYAANMHELIMRIIVEKHDIVPGFKPKGGINIYTVGRLIEEAPSINCSQVIEMNRLRSFEELAARIREQLLRVRHGVFPAARFNLGALGENPFNDQTQAIFSNLPVDMQVAHVDFTKNSRQILHVRRKIAAHAEGHSFFSDAKSVKKSAVNLA